MPAISRPATCLCAGGGRLCDPFDARRLETSGGPVPVVEASGARRRRRPGGTICRLRRGIARLFPGSASAPDGGMEVVLADRQRQLGAEGPRCTLFTVRASPNGKQLAVGNDGKEANISVYDMSGTSALRRLTYAGKNRVPVWSPDSKRVAFQSDREGDLVCGSRPITPGPRSA